MLYTWTTNTQTDALEVRIRAADWEDGETLGLFSPSEIGPLVGLIKAGFYVDGYTQDDMKIVGTQVVADDGGVCFEILLDAK